MLSKKKLDDVLVKISKEATENDVDDEHSNAEAEAIALGNQHTVASETFLREQTAGWYEATRKRVNILLLRLWQTHAATNDATASGTALVGTMHWLQRRDLVRLSACLLERCSALLDTATVEALLDCIVASTLDSQPMVCAAANTAIRRVSACDSAALDVHQAVVRGARRTALALPLAVQHTLYDSATLAALRRVRGYLTLLPSDCDVSLALHDTLRPLSVALLDLMQPTSDGLGK